MRQVKSVKLWSVSREALSRPTEEPWPEFGQGAAGPSSRHGEDEVRPTLSVCAPCRFRAITPEPSTVLTTIPLGTVPLNALPTIRKYSPGSSTVAGGMVARIRGVLPTQAWTDHPPMSASVEPVLRSSTNPLDPSAISFTLTGDAPGAPPNAAPASNRYVATVFPRGVTDRSLARPGGRHRGPKTCSAWDLREDGGRGVLAVHRFPDGGQVPPACPRSVNRSGLPWCPCASRVRSSPPCRPRRAARRAPR